MLSFAVLLLSAAAAGGLEKAVEAEATQRLSVAWSRSAIQMISEPSEPTPENFVGALEIARAGAALAPNDPAGWRIVLAIAAATKGGVPNAASAESEAVQQLSKLEPGDPVLRLFRLTEAVDRYPTADERIAVYEHLLKPESIAKMTPAIASRLCYDYSILLRRRGDAAAAVEQLRKSTQLDPAFPAAATQLAAYELEINAPIAQVAAALVDAIIANPAEVSNDKELGAMCLAEGLYAEADMLLGIACRIVEMNQRNNEYDALLTQQIMARWGMGQHKQALELFTKRKQQLQSLVRRKFDDRDGKINVALPPTLHAIRAAVARSGALPEADDAYKEALAAADDAIKAADKAAESDPDKDQTKKAMLLVEKAWLAVTLAPKPDGVAEWIAQAEAISPLAPEAKAKFDGWIAVRAGKNDEAIALLKPLAAQNTAARLGYATALLQSGNPKEAAKEYLAILRTERSNAIGLYAADRLAEIVKSRPGPSPSAPEIQAALAKLPKDFAKFGKDESGFLRVNAGFLATTVKPFEPLPYKIDIINQSPITLAISPDGPIDSRAALSLETITVGKPPTNMPPLVIALDRQFSIAPGETMSIVIDVARTPAVADLLGKPLNGANLQAEINTNFKLTLESVLPGFLGRGTPKSSVRITPVVRNNAWREEALGAIRHCDKPEDLVTFVLFAFDLASRKDDKAAEADVKAGWQELTQIWMEMPPAAQAWTLMVMPREPLDMTEPIAKAAKESKDFRVQMSAVLRWIDSEHDPLLDVVDRGGNGQLTAVAASIRSLINTRVREAATINQSLEEAGVLGGKAKANDTPAAPQR